MHSRTEKSAVGELSAQNFSQLPRDEFIRQNLPLVHALANRFRGRGIDYEDLYAAGSVGLVKAYDRFDSSMGLCFSTYAVPVILGEIRRMFRDGGAVKMSRSLKELSLRAARVRDELAAQGREPRISELAQRLGVSQEEAAEALSASMPPLSLTDDEDGGCVDVPQDSCEESLIDRLALRQSLAELPQEDRQLIILRYFRGRTQCETAMLLGITQVQVSRRERKIISQLREMLI